MIYNPFFEHRRIDAVVVPMGVASPDYESLFRTVFKLTNIVGALVTMPHKVTTVSLLDDPVVNATPLGMHLEDPLPMDVTDLESSTFVGEVVMKHEVTPVLQAAHDAAAAPGRHRHAVRTDTDVPRVLRLRQRGAGGAEGACAAFMRSPVACARRWMKSSGSSNNRAEFSDADQRQRPMQLGLTPLS